MTIRSLVIDGTPKDSADNCRFLVWINGDKVWLTYKSFCYIAKLAVACRIGEGWLHRTELELGENQCKYIYVLKAEIDNRIDIISNRRGSYLLNIDPRSVFFNHKAMAAFPDVLVKEAVELVEEPSNERKQERNDR